MGRAQFFLERSLKERSSSLVVASSFSARPPARGCFPLFLCLSLIEFFPGLIPVLAQASGGSLVSDGSLVSGGSLVSELVVTADGGGDGDGDGKAAVLPFCLVVIYGKKM